jgi:hypothetical protein
MNAPIWYIRLPESVGDAKTLALHLRQLAWDAAPGALWRRPYLPAADMLFRADARGLAELREVVRRCEVATNPEVQCEHARVWARIAHVVQRMADHLDGLENLA